MERTFQILNLIPAVGWQALACRIGKDGPITDSVPVVALAAVRYRYMDDSGKEYETEDRVEPVLRFDGDTLPELEMQTELLKGVCSVGGWVIEAYAPGETPDPDNQGLIHDARVRANTAVKS